jgi:hypothetical protein
MIHNFIKPVTTQVSPSEQFHEQGLVLFITLMIPTILLVLHITNVITMGVVGYVLKNL